MTFYVYILIDARCDTPFYVGKGKNSRKEHHFRDAKAGRCKNKHLERKILDIWRSGSSVNIEVIHSTDDETEAFLIERSTIQSLGRRGLGTGPLVNLTDGGEGVTNRCPETIRRNTESAAATRASWSKEKREELSRNASKKAKEFWVSLSASEKIQRTRHIKIWFENMSPEDRHKFSTNMKARNKKINTPEWRAKISQSCKKYWTDEKRINHGTLVKQKKALMSEEDRRSHSISVSKAVTKKWAEALPEERKAASVRMRKGITEDTNRKIAETVRQHFASMNAADRDKWKKARDAGSANVDWSVVLDKCWKTRAEWSPEKKAAYSEKMRENARKRWSMVKNA